MVLQQNTWIAYSLNHNSQSKAFAPQSSIKMNDKLHTIKYHTSWIPGLLKLSLPWGGEIISSVKYSPKSTCRYWKGQVYYAHTHKKVIWNAALKLQRQTLKKNNLKQCNIPFPSCENKASECRIWHQSCFSTVQIFEQHWDWFCENKGRLAKCHSSKCKRCLSLQFCSIEQNKPCHPLKKIQCQWSTTTRAYWAFNLFHLPKDLLRHQ